MTKLLLVPIRQADEVALARYTIQAAHAMGEDACLVLDLREVLAGVLFFFDLFVDEPLERRLHRPCALVGGGAVDRFDLRSHRAFAGQRRFEDRGDRVPVVGRRGNGQQFDGAVPVIHPTDDLERVRVFFRGLPGEPRRHAGKIALIEP